MAAAGVHACDWTALASHQKLEARSLISGTQPFCNPLLQTHSRQDGGARAACRRATSSAAHAFLQWRAHVAWVEGEAYATKAKPHMAGRPAAAGWMLLHDGACSHALLQPCPCLSSLLLPVNAPHVPGSVLDLAATPPNDEF
jgi:hypothetical protein